MTAPRWIAEAIEAVTSTVRGGEVFQEIPLIDAAKLPAALIERLPLEAIMNAARDCVDPAVASEVYERSLAQGVATRIVAVLTDGDPEVVELADLYQGACRELDAAGVPYAVDIETPQHLAIESASGEMSLHKLVQVHEEPAHPAQRQLDLAGRIRWLAQQRPTRTDLEHARGRDAHGASVREATAHAQRANTLRIEREHFEQLAGDLQKSLDDMSGVALRLQDERDLARTMHQDSEHRLRALEIAATDRQVLHAKAADQAAYIEQLEIEIDALEDEIWQDEP